MTLPNFSGCWFNGDVKKEKGRLRVGPQYIKIRNFVVSYPHQKSHSQVQQEE